MSIYFSKKVMLPTFTAEEIQKQVEKGKLAPTVVRGREFAKTKAGKQPPKKRKNLLRQRRKKKKKIVAKILEKKKDLHGNTV